MYVKRIARPKDRFCFQKIFGLEKHPKILISFLNATTKLENPIVRVEIKIPI